MAAGLVYHNLTTASGVTFTVATWVPDTTAPDVGAIPVHVITNSAGVPVDLATLIASTNTKLDTAITALQTIDNPDKGVGTGGSETQRVIIDSSQFAPSTDFVSGTTSAMTGTTTTSLVAAPGASLRNYITTLIVSNAHATVGTDVIIQDGSGGTTLLTIPAAAVYGGATITLPTPLRQPTTNTALFCANVTTGASTKVSAVGYKAA